MDKQQHYKTLFFDLDHTLWDFDANSECTLREVFETFSLGEHIRSFEKFFKVYKKENAYLWAKYRNGQISVEGVKNQRFIRTLRNVGAPLDNVDRIAEVYLDILPTKTDVFPHTFEILDYLKPKYQLALITNGFRGTQERKLKHSGLGAYFETMITSEEAGALKPNKQIFDYSVGACQTTHEESLMIGDDHKADILGAKMAGIDQVWFLGGAKRKRGRATYKIETLDQLRSIIHL